MRCLRLFLLFFAVIAPLNHGMASAQQTQAPACSGSYNIIRISEIKPGMMDTFLKAVAAQQAWYKSKGSNDKIGVERIVEHDASGYHYSEIQAITTHISDNTGQPAQDDAYKAFVALFNSSSVIKTTYHTCVLN